MQIANPDSTRTCPEIEIIQEKLDLAGKSIIELGCGTAELTRLIAERYNDATVLALEVDEVQHAHNLGIDDLPNVEFGLAGAQSIPAPDNSTDVVLMFKSLHHVPGELLDQSLTEVARVLKPGGQAYISEPVFAGEFNDILRLFHDEQAVREAAFSSTCRAVESGVLALEEQVFFNTPVRFADFADFEAKVIGVSHTQHHLSPEVYEQVKARFAKQIGANGAEFVAPIRVDLLRKPAA
jgi:SAM-dependent methyltransferase